jgi:hypothetical protein
VNASMDRYCHILAQSLYKLPRMRKLKRQDSSVVVGAAVSGEMGGLTSGCRASIWGCECGLPQMVLTDTPRCEYWKRMELDSFKYLN